MKHRLFVMVAIAILGVLALVPALAQDAATPEVGMGTINCDADLLLNLYIADRFFGYSAVQNQLMQGGMTGAVDTAVFNTGQFGTLFTTSRGMQDPNTGLMTNSGWTTDQVTGLANSLSQDETAFSDSWNTAFGGDPAMANVMPLPSSMAAGEAPECTQLRTSLYRFWQAVALQDFSGGMTSSFSSGDNMGGSTTDMGGAATPEATPGS
ncbi:MAG TPA: hypothetical protein VHO69_00235 [Phototrophicaceae bacterium]|nr:hypothetical protein [Phototrophicaceae bacterium]